MTPPPGPETRRPIPGRAVMIRTQSLSALRAWALSPDAQACLAGQDTAVAQVLDDFARSHAVLLELEADLRTELQHFYGVTLSAEQMSAFIERHPALGETLLQMDEVGTSERETAIDLLALDLTGQGWPLYADQAGPEFFAAFKSAAQQAGYAVENGA